eukprot:1393877-Amorphochlora_amoeboformis.AAC.2
MNRYTHKPFCPGDPSFPISWDGKKSKARQPTTDEKGLLLTGQILITYHDTKNTCCGNGGNGLGFDDEGPPQCAKDPCDNVDLYEGACTSFNHI